MKKIENSNNPNQILPNGQERKIANSYQKIIQIIHYQFYFIYGTYLTKSFWSRVD